MSSLSPRTVTMNLQHQDLEQDNLYEVDMEQLAPREEDATSIHSETVSECLVRELLWLPSDTTPPTQAEQQQDFSFAGSSLTSISESDVPSERPAHSQSTTGIQPGTIVLIPSGPLGPSSSPTTPVQYRSQSGELPNIGFFHADLVVEGGQVRCAGFCTLAKTDKCYSQVLTSKHKLLLPTAP